MTSIQPSTPQRDTHLNTAATESNAPSSAKIDIPLDFDPSISLDFLQSSSMPTPIRERVVHVQALSEEKLKLERELREMDERLKAAELKSEELKKKKAA